MFIPTPNRNERLLKYALAGLGATLVLALLSALYFDVKPPVRSGQEETKQEAALSPEAELKLQEQVSPLIKAGDMKACERVDNAMYRSVCVNNIALQKAEETGDISFCQYLDDELIPKETCERQVIFRKSVDEGNTNACAETGNAALRQECENTFSSRIATEKEDPSLCDQSTNKLMSDQCWNGYYANRLPIAIKTSDMQASICGIFRGEDVKADCDVIVENMREGDLEKTMEACQAQKTGIFLQSCMMSFRNMRP